MLDPPPTVVERVEEVGDVPNGEDPGGTRLVALIHHDAVVEREPAGLEKLDAWDDAHADDGEIHIDSPAALRRERRQPGSAPEEVDLFLRPQIDAVGSVEGDEFLAQLLASEPLKQAGTWMNQAHVEIEAAQRGGDFQADEAAAYDHRTPRPLGDLADRIGVSQRAQREHTVELGAANVQTAWLRSGSDQELLVAVVRAIPNGHRALAR